GHGGQVDEPQRLVRAYLLHRRLREQAILDCIRAGNNTVRGIVPVIYKDLDPRLLNAASLSVLAHVEHLMERGLLRSSAPLSFDRVLSASGPSHWRDGCAARLRSPVTLSRRAPAAR